MRETVPPCGGSRCSTLALPAVLWGALLVAVGCTSNPIQSMLKSPLTDEPDPEQLLSEADAGESEPAWLGADKLRGLSLPDVSLPKVSMDGLLSAGVPTSSDAQQVYNEADQVFQQASSATGRARTDGFTRASALYAKAADRAVSAELKENALFMVGESRFFADEYPRAIDAFDALIKQFPRTRHMDRIDKRRFAIAQYWEKQADGFRLTPNITDNRLPNFDAFGHALRVYNRIRFDDPTGKLADDATMAAGVANFQAGRYALADGLFEDLRQNFASSEHQFQAHLLLLKCKMKRYQGAEYDGAVLEEAQDIIQQLVVQFPDEVGPHREYLEDEAKRIRLMLAERLYAKAEYRDRRKEYRAARMLYQQVREEYGDTSLALESETRLAQLGGLPDVPEERLQWLADLFPDEEQPKPLLATDPTKSKLR